MRTFRLYRASHAAFQLRPRNTSYCLAASNLWSRRLIDRCHNGASVASHLSQAPIRGFLQHQFHYSTIKEPAPTGSTIYALSTAAGKAAIAVIRVSGPACKEIYNGLCPLKPLPKARKATVRTLFDPSVPPSRDSILDPSALILYFPSPNTVTGEEVLELHVHGGSAIVKAVLAAIPRCSSSVGLIRYAEPGEFTKRAFLNDRMDLTQIEALGDTLSATTEQQRKLSVRGTTKGLAKRYEDWRIQLVYARGELEALIDFSEDQHFDESPDELAASVAVQVRGLLAQIEAHRENAVRGELLRNGISIALLGAPNAGKSSLLNLFVGREAAIVSQEAGTTRDVVEVGIDFGGWFCRLADTAGLRKGGGRVESSMLQNPDSEHVGEIETEGIRRAKQRALEADLVIIVQSYETLRQGHPPEPFTSAEVTDTINQCLARGIRVISAINKADLFNPESSHESTIDRKWTYSTYADGSVPALPISCKEALTTRPSAENPDPGNIQAFLRGVTETFQQMTAPFIPELGQNAGSDSAFWQESLGATERQRLLLTECVAKLEEFLAQVQVQATMTMTTTTNHDDHLQEADGESVLDIVVAAESLRAAADCLARITGKGEAGDVEEVLGVVFEK